MSKNCPIYGKAIYMDCLECEEKLCRKDKSKPMQSKYKTICIGIDQSYKNTGVSVSADGELKKIAGIELGKYKSNSEKRKALKKYLSDVVTKILPQAYRTVCVIERIRLRSQGFINIDYIKSIGALNSVIVDVMDDFGIEVYSVDTRCWKSQVVGTSKGMSNRFGVPEEKWPTVRFIIKQGYKQAILQSRNGFRGSKGIFIDQNGNKWSYDNDRADSGAISLFWWRGDHDKLKIEH